MQDPRPHKLQVPLASLLLVAATLFCGCHDSSSTGGVSAVPITRFDLVHYESAELTETHGDPEVRSGGGVGPEGNSRIAIDFLDMNKESILLSFLVQDPDREIFRVLFAPEGSHELVRSDLALVHVPDGPPIEVELEPGTRIEDLPQSGGHLEFTVSNARRGTWFVALEARHFMGRVEIYALQ